MKISQEQKINLAVFIMLVILSTIIGFFAIKFLSGPLSGDSTEYDKLAKSLAFNNAYVIVNNYWSAPGYPLFLAVIYKIIGANYILIYFLQFILLGISGFIIYIIGKSFFNLSVCAAFLPAFVIITWPYAIYYASQLLTETLYTTLLVIFAYFFLLAINKENKYHAGLAGFFLGEATLTRPISLLLPIWAVLLAIIYKSIKNKKILFVFFFISYIVIAPWIIYPTLKFKKLIPITASVASLREKESPYLNEWTFYKTPGYEPAAEVTIKKIAIIKIKNFFRFWRSGLNGNWFDNISNRYSILKYLLIPYRFYYYSIIFFFFYSSIKYFRNKNFIFLFSIPIYAWLVHALMRVQPRYTIPIMPFVIFFSCLGLYKFILKIKNAKQSQTKTL